MAIINIGRTKVKKSLHKHIVDPFIHQRGILKDQKKHCLRLAKKS